MADAGLKVTNVSGEVQIDSNYRNFHLINKMDAPHYYDRKTGKASVALDNYTPLRPYSIIAYGLDPWYRDEDLLPLSSLTLKDYFGAIVRGKRFTQPYFTYYGKRSYDCKAIMPSYEPGEPGDHSFAGTAVGSYVHREDRLSSGPVWHYTSYYFQDQMPTQADNINFSVYEFDLIDLGESNSKFGMQVFDGSGSVVFDSNYKPMRVVKFFTAPPVYVPNGTALPDIINVWDLPVKDGSRKYAIAPLGTPYRFYNQYVAGYYDGRDYVTSSGGSIQDTFTFQRSRILHQVAPVPIDERYLHQYLYTGADAVSYLLLDVTGY